MKKDNLIGISIEGTRFVKPEYVNYAKELRNKELKIENGK